MRQTRITHFSDWHGQIHPLPSAEIYVCTGDMLWNSRMWRWVDKEPERSFQRDWASRSSFDKYMGKATKPDAQVLVVRGNHDFLDLDVLWREHTKVYEFREPSVIEVGGLRFGGFRGVLRIDGEQSDELGEQEIAAKLDRLGPVDVLVTHGPAAGILDGGFGSCAIADYIERWRGKPLRAHLHGHIHEEKGMRCDDDGFLHSNAATGVNKVEI